MDGTGDAVLVPFRTLVETMQTWRIFRGLPPEGYLGGVPVSLSTDRETDRQRDRHKDTQAHKNTGKCTDSDIHKPPLQVPPLPPPPSQPRCPHQQVEEDVGDLGYLLVVVLDRGVHLPQEVDPERLSTTRNRSDRFGPTRKESEKLAKARNVSDRLGLSNRHSKGRKRRQESEGVRKDAKDSEAPARPRPPFPAPGNR